jgi:hypothetical protein
MSKRERMSVQRQPEVARPTPSQNAPERRALDFVNHHAGRALDPVTRSAVEPRFGHSFADIRVHADGESARVADGIDAAAITLGQDIVFNQDEYAPGTRDGDFLLAHELAHTVQNRSWRRGALDKTLSAPSDPAELDARQAAQAAVSGESAQVNATPAAAIAASPKVEDVEKEDVQAADVADWKFAHSDADQGMTEAEKKKTGGAKTLAYHPAAAGARESNLSYEASAALPSVKLYDTTRAEGGAKIKAFESAYNMFRLPMQMTMDSLGRVQDLLTAGAPQTPSEMSKAEKGVFHKLGHGKSDSEAKSVYGQWADHTSGLDQSMDHYMGVYQQLQGAAAQWRGMKEIIVRKQAQAQLHQKTEKLEKLEAPAKTIAMVVEVFESAATHYEALAPKPEAAAEAVGAEEAKEIAEQPGGLPTDLDTDAHTKAQRGLKVGTRVKELGEHSAGGALTLEGVIEWAMGDSDEIAGLKSQCAALRGQIEAANERAEDFQIDAAIQTLSGITRENRTAALGVATERTKARQSAEVFAGVMGGENVDARLVTLCAEAYQELRIFADHARETYPAVAENLPAVMAYVSQTGHANDIIMTRQHRRAADEAGEPAAFLDNDYESLLEAAKSAKTFGALMASEYAKWVQRANLWEASFTVESGGNHLDEHKHQAGRGG